MNTSRIFVTTATALSVLFAIGCTSPQRAPEVAAAPVVDAAPPPQVATTDAMPSHPALQNEHTAAAAVPINAPAAVAYEPVVTTPAPSFTERPPRTDHN